MNDIQKGTTYVDYARNEIKRGIQNGTYPPGMKLSALELASQLGISRTPVITAINQLIDQGLLEKVSPRTTIVKELTLSQIREILQIREMIEQYAAGLIVRNIPFYPETVAELDQITQKMSQDDDEVLSNIDSLETRFHTLLISLTGNTRLTEIYESNWSIGIVFTLFARSKTSLYRRHETLFQHKKMLDMAKIGDADGLRNVFQEHVKIVNDTLDWILSQNTNEVFIPD